ncbi:MAG: ATP-grasp domain-containing protein [Acidobacteria bacterium]|nr:ATP-grasp domain-containing protein [Acidobacteriota bacterium]
MAGGLQSTAEGPRRILLVGYRRDALDAAFGLGFEVSVVAERLPSAARRARCRVTRTAGLDRDRDWRSLADRLDPERRLDGVVALTERAVEPAARIRQALGLPGLSTDAATACTDKLVMKRRIRAAGLPCTEFLGDDEGPLTAAELIGKLGLPLVLKGRRGSGSRVVRIVRRRGDLPDRLPEGWMAERWVRGVEMSLETFWADGEALLVNPTEYTEPRWVNLVPAPVPARTLGAVLELNRAAVHALGVGRGMTHLELFLTDHGPVFGEVAARPPGGHLMELLERVYGFDPWRAVLRLEVGQRPELPTTPRGLAAVRVLHPGSGTVRSVRGLEAARRLPGVARAQLRLRPGQRVPEREGLGQEVGHLTVIGTDRELVLERLAAASTTIHVELDPDPPGRARPETDSEDP